MSSRAFLALLLISVLQILRLHWAFGIGFINDDFLYLDHARTLDFWKCWSFADALGNDYRPIPRNLYFWAGLKLFGREPWPYHTVNLAIGTASLWLLFFALRRMLSGFAAAPGAPATQRAVEAPAALGVLLFSLHPASGTPLSWVCGVQDLLSVAFALAAVLAHLGRRRAGYLALFLASLLCKKTAVLLPGVLALYDVLVERERLGIALLRQLGALALLAAWAWLDPWLPWNVMGRQVYSAHPGHGSVLGHSSGLSLAVTARSLLLAGPFERFHWPYGWVETELQLALLAWIVWLASGLGWPRRPGGRAVAVGLAWCIAGILPVVALINRALYYAYYPGLGFTLAGMATLAWLARRRGFGPPAATALAAALALILCLSAGFAWPPRLFDAAAVRRASSYLEPLRASLLLVRPALADSTRCYFWHLPENVGFQVADGPAVRVWTGNPTLQGFFINAYLPSAGRPARFFRGDSLGVLSEIVRGEEREPRPADRDAYADAHAELGAHLYLAGERDAGIVEWRKALLADPTHLEAGFNLGAALVDRGHPAEALPLLRRVVVAAPGNEQARNYLRLAVARSKPP